jgi:hypothetical protein
MQKIASAFIKAKRAFSPALKDKTNPAFRSKYADLGACLEAVNDALLENGIAVYQETHDDAAGVTVETVLLHESGESLRSGKFHVPAAKHDPQGYGSALTYARRYSLMTACGIAPEDDDGNAGTDAKRRQDITKGGSVRHAVRDGIGENLPPEDKEFLRELGEWCVAHVSTGEAVQVVQHIAKQNLDADQRVYLENQMDSKTRAAIKKAETDIRTAFNQREKATQ